MALTTNTDQNGINGIDQKFIADAINSLISAVYVLANKLDADGGVTANDFTADVENVISSGAQLLGCDDISTEVQAAIA